MGEPDTIVGAALVQQATTHITAIGTRLTDEKPIGFPGDSRFSGNFKQAGEGIALTPAVLTHRIVEGVGSLITGRGTCKTTHRFRLRTEEGGGTLRQDETAGLALYHTDTGITFGIDLITEGHVAVADTEDDIHHGLVVLQVGGHALVGLITHLALFDIIQGIGLADRHRRKAFLQGQSLGVVTDIRHHTKSRAVQHRLSLIVDAITGFAPRQLEDDLNLPVGTPDGLGLSPHRQAQQCRTKHHRLFHIFFHFTILSFDNRTHPHPHSRRSFSWHS